MERGPAEAALALAIIHHLAVTNNLLLDRIARFFRKMCTWLIIEFVPKNDPQVQKLLSTREDIFLNYRKDAFEAEFAKLFKIQSTVPIRNSERTLYLMQAR